MFALFVFRSSENILHLDEIRCFQIENAYRWQYEFLIYFLFKFIILFYLYFLK